MSRKREKFVLGDLVWAKVKGYPNWPGQVMNEDSPFIAESKKKKIRDMKNPKTPILCSFFGDGSFGWFHERDLFTLDDETLEENSTTKMRLKPVLAAKFKQAVEEARQILDLRCGRTPATQHEHVLDFLNEEEIEAYLVELGRFKAPDPFLSTIAAEGKLQAKEALRLLRQTAAQLHFDPKADPLGITAPPKEQTDALRAARSWIFSTRQTQLANAERQANAGAKRRKAAARRRMATPEAGEEEGEEAGGPWRQRKAPVSALGPIADFTPGDWERAEVCRVDRAECGPAQVVRTLRELAADPLRFLTYRPASRTARLPPTLLEKERVVNPEKCDLTELAFARDYVEGSRLVEALAALARYREEAFEGSVRNEIFPVALRFSNFESFEALFSGYFASLPPSDRLPWDPALSQQDRIDRLKAQGKVAPIGYHCARFLQILEHKRATPRALPAPKKDKAAAATGVAKKKSAAAGVGVGKAVPKKRARDAESSESSEGSSSSSESESEDERPAKRKPAPPATGTAVVGKDKVAKDKGPVEKKRKAMALEVTETGVKVAAKPPPAPRLVEKPAAASGEAGQSKDRERERDKQREREKDREKERLGAKGSSVRPSVPPAPTLSEPMCVLNVTFEGVQPPSEELVRTEFRTTFDALVQSVVPISGRGGSGYRVTLSVPAAENIMYRHHEYSLFSLPPHGSYAINYDTGAASEPEPFRPAYGRKEYGGRGGGGGGRPDFHRKEGKHKDRHAPWERDRPDRDRERDRGPPPPRGGDYGRRDWADRGVGWRDSDRPSPRGGPSFGGARGDVPPPPPGGMGLGSRAPPPPPSTTALYNADQDPRRRMADPRSVPGAVIPPPPPPMPAQPATQQRPAGPPAYTVGAYRPAPAATDRGAYGAGVPLPVLQPPPVPAPSLYTAQVPVTEKVDDLMKKLEQSGAVVGSAANGPPPVAAPPAAPSISTDQLQENVASALSELDDLF